MYPSFFSSYTLSIVAPPHSNGVNSISMQFKKKKPKKYHLLSYSSVFDDHNFPCYCSCATPSSQNGSSLSYCGFFLQIRHDSDETNLALTIVALWAKWIRQWVFKGWGWGINVVPRNFGRSKGKKNRRRFMKSGGLVLRNGTLGKKERYSNLTLKAQ